MLRQGLKPGVRVLFVLLRFVEACVAAELSPARADVAVTDHRGCVFPTRLNGAITGCRPPLSKHTSTHAMHSRARAALNTISPQFSKLRLQRFVFRFKNIRVFKIMNAC